METANLGNMISPKIIAIKFPLDILIYYLNLSFWQEDFIYFEHM
jgi:hypothetical protein